MLSYWYTKRVAYKRLKNFQLALCYGSLSYKYFSYIYMKNGVSKDGLVEYYQNMKDTLLRNDPFSRASRAPFFFLSFLTRASTAFSAHFSSSSPCFQPNKRFTYGDVKLHMELIPELIWIKILKGMGKAQALVSVILVH